MRTCFNTGSKRYPDWYIGAVGFLASYNGRFFDGGYSGIVHTKAGTVRNYYDEGRRNLMEQIPYLTGIGFRYCDYAEYRPADWGHCLFYCDPPYKGTKAVRGQAKTLTMIGFGSGPGTWQFITSFWSARAGAPEDIRCIWERPIKRTIDNNKRVDTIERLYLVGDRYGA